MTTTQDRPHLSIGELLAALRAEFPDVTISKIRFLESQGLLDPERTPSGYRKFYDADVDRLRWILAQQKENFLPLKVIKDRLEGMESGPFVAPDPEPEPEPEPKPKRRTVVAGKGKAAKTTPRRVAGRRSRKLPAPSADALPLPLDDDTDDDLTPELASSRSSSKRAAAAMSGGGVSLTKTELARASGLKANDLAQLETYGLLEPALQRGDRVLFDEEGMAIAQLAAGFFRHGIDARHLRMYRQFAEREVGLFEQVLLPILRQRNPESRAKAHEQLAELAKLGRGLRAAYLRLAVREALGE